MHPKRLETRILKAASRGCRDFSLLAEGDRILVALSGGKDSYGLLWALEKLRAAASFRFDLFTYHLDQGQPGHDPSPIEAHMREVGLPYEIEYQDTYTRVVEKTEGGKIYCSLCSRFRRAILYKAATRHGCNKVALGHHRDDLIETLLLNLFFSGQIKSMPPRLVSDGGTHEVIRPLCYVPEEELIELSEQLEFPVVPCRLCGSLEAQRQSIKKLLAELSQQNRHLKGNLLAALGRVRTTHLLDPNLNPLFRSGDGADADPEAADLTDSADGGSLEALVQLGAGIDSDR